MARLWNFKSFEYSGKEKEEIMERTLGQDEKEAGSWAYQKAGGIRGEATSF